MKSYLEKKGGKIKYYVYDLGLKVFPNSAFLPLAVFQTFEEAEDFREYISNKNNHITYSTIQVLDFIESKNSIIKRIKKWLEKVFS